MSAGSNTVLVDYRMEKARESIKAARIMLNEKMLTFAMNRIYYAMFYAVQAALSKKGVSFSGGSKKNRVIRASLQVDQTQIRANQDLTPARLA